MDRLDRRLQPSRFARLTAWPRTSASFHAVARAEPRVPGPGLVMAGPGQPKRLKAALRGEGPDLGGRRGQTPVVHIPRQARHQRADRTCEDSPTRMQYRHRLDLTPFRNPPSRSLGRRGRSSKRFRSCVNAE